MVATLIREGTSSFQKEQKKKVALRREKEKLESQARKIRRSGGSANVEIIGGKPTLIEIRAPEIIATRSDTGAGLTRTDVNVLQRQQQAENLRQANIQRSQYRESQKPLSERQSTISGVRTGVSNVLINPLQQQAKVLGEQRQAERILAQSRIPEINFTIKLQVEKAKKQAEAQKELSKRLGITSSLAPAIPVLSYLPNILSNIELRKQLNLPATATPTRLNQARIKMQEAVKIISRLRIDSNEKLRLLREEQNILLSKLRGITPSKPSIIEGIKESREENNKAYQIIKQEISKGVGKYKSYGDTRELESITKNTDYYYKRWKSFVNKKFENELEKTGFDAKKYISQARSLASNKELNNIGKEPLLLYALGYMNVAENLYLRGEKTIRLVFGNLIIGGSDILLKLQNKEFRKQINQDIIIPAKNYLALERKKERFVKFVKENPKLVLSILKTYDKEDYKKAFVKIKELVKDVSNKSIRKIVSGAKTTSNVISAITKKEVLKEISPFINKYSSSGFKKAIDGDVKSITPLEFSNMVQDLSLIGGLTKRAGLKLIGNPFKRLAQNTLYKKLIVAPSIVKVATFDFALSIMKNTAFASRIYEASKKAYGVDIKYLKSQANKLGFNNETKLLNNYNSYIAQELKKDGLNWRDYANFAGLTTGSEKSIIDAQKRYSFYLKNQGYSQDNINKMLRNLEILRRAQIISKIGAFTKLEISSDVLATKLAGKGLSIKRSIDIAVVREGISDAILQSHISGTNYTPVEVFLGTLFGFKYSQWASKQGYKKIKLTPSQTKSYINKLSFNLSKKLSPKKIIKYNEKLIKQVSKVNNQSLTKKQISMVVNRMSPKEKRFGAQQHIKSIIIDNSKKRGGKPINYYLSPKKNILKDAIVNFFDPAEYSADKVQDLSESLSKLLNKITNRLFNKKIVTTIKQITRSRLLSRVSKAKLRNKIKGKVFKGKKLKKLLGIKPSKKKIKVTPRKSRKVKPKLKRQKRKIKSFVKSRVKSKIRSKKIARTRLITKLTSRAKPKTSARPMTKVKPRVRPKIRPSTKPKIRPRIKPRPRPRPRPRPKPKPKPRPRPRPRVRVKVVFTRIPFFDLQNLPVAYTLFGVTNNNKLVKYNVKGGFAQIVNKGINISKGKDIKGFIVKRVGVLSTKPKSKVVSSKLKTFKVLRGKDSIRFTKKNNNQRKK